MKPVCSIQKLRGGAGWYMAQGSEVPRGSRNIQVYVVGIAGSGRTSVSLLIYEALQKAGLSAVWEDEDAALQSQQDVEMQAKRLAGLKGRGVAVNVKTVAVARSARNLTTFEGVTVALQEAQKVLRTKYKLPQEGFAGALRRGLQQGDILEEPDVTRWQGLYEMWHEWVRERGWELAAASEP